MNILKGTPSYGSGRKMKKWKKKNQNNEAWEVVEEVKLTRSENGAWGYLAMACATWFSSVIRLRADFTDDSRSSTSLASSSASISRGSRSSEKLGSWQCLILLAIFTASDKSPPLWRARVNAAITKGSRGSSTRAWWNANMATLQGQN